MKSSNGCKLVLLTLISLCFLSLWTFMPDSGYVAIVPDQTSFHGRSSITGKEIKNIKLPNNGYGWAILSTAQKATEKTIIIKQNGTIAKAHNENSNVSIVNKNNMITTDYSTLNGTSTRSPNTILPTTNLHRTQRHTILVSYMRSGSTFTGDLFQSSPDVFYLYEPLLYTNDADELARNTPIRHRLISKFSADANPPETLDYTLATLRCNLTESKLKYMIGYLRSRSFHDYAKCFARGQLAICGPKITRRCQQSPHVISKILRLKMWEVDELLTRDPELRIIHLVRDPRGITVSRREANFYLNIPTLCGRMNKDGTMSVELQKKYPGRILTVRYEDLALSPLNITRQLYQHARVEWTPGISNRVQDLTSPNNISFNEKMFGTKRKNSSVTAFNWRRKLLFQKANEIQKMCREMMELYGYINFRSREDILNLQFSSLKDEYSNSFYKALKVSPVES